MKKKSLFLLASTAVVMIVTVVVVLGVGSVSAFRNGEGTLVENLANRFGVTEEEVEDVFEETREQKRDERLNEFVEKGTISEDQKQLIIEKMEEMHQEREDNFNRDMSMEERHEYRESHREEMRTWMEENEIPLEVMMPRRGRRAMGRGMMRDGARKDRGTQSGDCTMN